MGMTDHRSPPSPNEQKVLDALRREAERAPSQASSVGWDLDSITYICSQAGFIRHRNTIRDHVQRLYQKGWLAKGRFAGGSSRKRYTPVERVS